MIDTDNDLGNAIGTANVVRIVEHDGNSHLPSNPVCGRKNSTNKNMGGCTTSVNLHNSNSMTTQLLLQGESIHVCRNSNNTCATLEADHPSLFTNEFDRYIPLSVIP